MEWWWAQLSWAEQSLDGQGWAELSLDGLSWLGLNLAELRVGEPIVAVSWGYGMYDCKMGLRGIGEVMVSYLSCVG